MDFAEVLKIVIDFVVYYWSKEFVFAGYTATVGAVVVWCAVACLVIGIVRGLSS